MLIDNIKNVLIASLIGIAVGASCSWYAASNYLEAQWQHTIDAQKIEASTKLQQLTGKAIAKDKEVSTLKDALEKKYAKAQETISSTLDANRRLAAQLGGLRDPGRGNGCSVPLPTDPGAPGSDTVTPASSQLSDEASQFLLEFAADADRAAQYANSCHDWAVGFPKIYQLEH